MTQIQNDFLESLGDKNEGIGVLRDQLIAARDAAVLVPLADLGLIRASGEEAAGFLHNLLSNDIKSLETDTVRLAGFCTAKGRLLATPLVWRDGSDFLLLLSADLLPAILKKLSMYVLRSKVKLSDASNERVVLGLAGPNAAAVILEFGLAVPDELKLTSFAAGQVFGLGGSRYVLILDPNEASAVWNQLALRATAARLAAWHWREIAAGVPRIVAATQEAFVPQMVNLELVGGVSFTKGCYPGQEIVARTHYLGKVKRRMYRAKVGLDAAAGTALFSAAAGDQSCGALVQVAPSPDGEYECLAVIQSPSAEAGDVRVGSADGPPLHLLFLPYALPD
jgi:folate-binding protein YgfZ